MSPLLGVTALLTLLAIALVATQRHRLASVVGGLVLGPMGYFVSGIQVARARGRGQFHSLPFGGIEAGDDEMLASLAVWVMGSVLFLLLFLATLLAAIWWLRRSKRSEREVTPPRRSPRDATDRMVRDRVCNTFLPRSRALVVHAGGEEFFFCSEDCRDKHPVAEKSR